MLRKLIKVRQFSTIHESVQEYYGKILSSSKDLKTNACTSSSRPSKEILNILTKVPKPITDKFYGCGTPLPSGGIEGLNLLDLGCGSGRDCYIASALVGANGIVTGLDMTEEQLKVARDHSNDYTKKVLNYPKNNLRFVKGYLESLSDAGIANNSQDMIISNCVINLSPNKEAVLSGMFQALKYGGEAYFSDVYCDRRLPEHVKKNEVLWGECLAGALYIEDFVRICRKVGFNDPRILEQSPIEVTDPNLQDILGNAKFYSITYRLFKCENMETLCEDYGQVATYLGTLPGNKHSYALDDHHLFVTNKPMLVCGNTASMVSETWLKKHFKVHGDRSVHYGLFDCSSSPILPSDAMTSCDATGGGGGSCC
jgi:arsenite methyltransferase